METKLEYQELSWSSSSVEYVKIFLIKAPSCNVESVIDRLGLSKFGLSLSVTD